MDDVPAIELVKNSTRAVEEIGQPPDDYHRIEEYVRNCNKIFQRSKDNIYKIGDYITTLSDLLKNLTRVVNEKNKLFQVSMSKALQRLKEAKAKKATQRKGSGDGNGSLNDGDSLAVISPRNIKPDIDDTRILQIMQDVAMQGALLQQLTAETNNRLATEITLPDIACLVGQLDELKKQTDKTCRLEDEEERRKQDEERKRRQAEEARKKRERMERQKQKDEERKQREEEERKRKEREEEEERKRKEMEEEEERKRKEKEKEEERLRKEKEEEERKKKEEEERKRKEEERKEIERKKREEEERKRKEKAEREKKRIEEERRRRLDPKNWELQIFRTGSDDANRTQAPNGDICCAVSAIDNDTKDILCNIDREFGNGSDEAHDSSDEAEDDIDESDESTFEIEDEIVCDNERFASSLVTIGTRSGKMKKLEKPMQIFIPCADNIKDSDESEELVIKSSVDGGPWTENKPIKPVKEFKEARLIGRELNSFTNVKMIAVSRAKRETFSVGEKGGRQVSGNVALDVPQAAFRQKTSISMKVTHESCGGSNGASVISVQFSNPPETSVTVDITESTETKQVATTSYAVVNDENNAWKYADKEDSEKTTSVQLPAQRKRVNLIKLRRPQEESVEKVLQEAANIHARAVFTAAVIVIRQGSKDPSQGIVQCVRSDDVNHTHDDLRAQGYSIGPDASAEVYTHEKAKIQISCEGNIVFVSDRRVKKTLHFLANWRSKKCVTFAIKSKYYQRDASSFSGEVVSTFHRKPGTPGQSIVVRQTVTLPKDNTVPKRHYGDLSTDLIALASSLSYLLAHKCSGSWRAMLEKLCGGALVRKIIDKDQNLDGEQICKRAITEWIHSKPDQFNKLNAVQNVLKTSSFPQLVAPINDFMALCKGDLSDESMKVISSCIDKSRDLVEVAEDLMLSPEELDEFIYEFHDEECTEMESLLFGWRFNNTSIKAGNEALATLKSLLRIESK